MGWNAANEVKLQSLDFKHLLYTINLFREGAHSDVTLICKDGRTQANSFFIAAIFPVVKNVLSVSQFFDEDIFISLPDVKLSEIEVLFKGIQHCDEILQVGSGIKHLLHLHEHENGVEENPIEHPSLSEDVEHKKNTSTNTIMRNNATSKRVSRAFGKKYACKQCDNTGKSESSYSSSA